MNDKFQHGTFWLGFLTCLVVCLSTIIGLAFTPTFKKIHFTVNEREHKIVIPPNKLVIMPVPYDQKNTPSLPEIPKKKAPKIW